MNRQTRTIIARALTAAAARLEAGVVMEARFSMAQAGVVLKKAFRTMGLQPAVSSRLIETLMTALASSELTESHKIDVLAAVVKAANQIGADLPEEDAEESAEVPSLLVQVQKHLRKALLVARVPVKLAAVLAKILVSSVASVRASPDQKRSLLNTLAMDIESAMVGVPATQPSVANPESKKTKRKAKLLESMDAVQQQIDNGRLRGTIKQHVRIARAFGHKHKANLSNTHAELASMAPAGAKVKARVKTLDSAVGKVARKPKDFVSGKGYQSAAGLQDGTGSRIIAKTLDGVLDTVKNVKDKFDIIEEDDYITHPKEGYRSYHLVYRASDGLAKELQVRTENQHIFAEWCHDVYKPETPAQKEAMAVNGEEVRAYMHAISEMLNNRDLGIKSPAPECPASVREAFGCIE